MCPGGIRVRIGEAILTAGATIRDRNRLMKASWNTVLALKGETKEKTEGPPLPIPDAPVFGKGSEEPIGPSGG